MRANSGSEAAFIFRHDLAAMDFYSDLAAANDRRLHSYRSRSLQ
jgi:hypothetical protein